MNNQTNNQPLGIKPIGTKQFKIGDYFHLSWVFEKWWEKLLLFIIMLLGFIEVIQLAWEYLM